MPGQGGFSQHLDLPTAIRQGLGRGTPPHIPRGGFRDPPGLLCSCSGRCVRVLQMQFIPPMSPSRSTFCRLPDHPAGGHRSSLASPGCPRRWRCMNCVQLHLSQSLGSEQIWEHTWPSEGQPWGAPRCACVTRQMALWDKLRFFPARAHLSLHCWETS